MTRRTPAAREIETGSRWIVNGVGGSGNVYETIERREGDHPSDYRVRLVKLGLSSDPFWSVGDEFTVDREWFDLRAREVAP